MPDTLHIWSYLILTTSQQGGCNYSHFARKKTESQRESNLFLVTQLESREVWVKSNLLTSNSLIFTLYHYVSSCPGGTSLVAQWLRICLPMKGIRVRPLVREDRTCCRATKPVCHSYWALVPQLRKLMRLEPLLHKRSHHNEKPTHRNEE